MATWCIESAYALHNYNREVLLIHHPNVKLDKDIPFPTLAFESPTEKYSGITFLKPLWLVKHILSSRSLRLTNDLYTFLKERGVHVEFFLLNQSNFVSEKLDIPQYVCSWVYPLTIKRYLLSSYRSIENFSLKHIALTILNSIGFYRKDKRAYKFATGVLSLTPVMHEELLKRGLKSVLAPPCIRMSNGEIGNLFNKRVRLVISALDLESKRKNVTWMLDAIENIQYVKFDIILIGHYSHKLSDRKNKSRHNYLLTGKLSRENALLSYIDADIFLFASLTDDWGYVLIEAMANGLIAIAPNRKPFDYILGDDRLLFNFNSQFDFIQKILHIARDHSTIIELKSHCYNRTKHLFSSNRFGEIISNFIG